MYVPGRERKLGKWQDRVATEEKTHWKKGERHISLVVALLFVALVLLMGRL